MESLEFDATLGGEEHLPYSANILKFASSRSVEIAAMTESLLRPSQTKLIFQNLPIHMRRRVMSHNCKRLPIKLRQGHLEQLKRSGIAPKQKRPSRKYRRRPANLLEEYNRRQKRNIWLETHIWHAKRFHMIDHWGYRLAHRSCDKAFRACYRASSAHCLLQDISYYTPICISGPVDDIKYMFASLTSSNCGLSITARAYINGNREGSINLYKANAYPFGYIGKIQFIWVQSDDSNKELWLFAHPAHVKQLETVLSGFTTYGSSISSDQCKRRKLDSKYITITIKTMPGILNRFRLTGPRSHAVLMQSLKCVDDISKIKCNDWVSHITEKKCQLYLKEKYDYWQNLKEANSPSQLSPKLVLGLVVRDPRLSRPAIRTKAQFNICEKANIQPFINIPQFSSISPLWDTNVRDKINAKKVTNAQFIEHISNSHLVPGEINEDDPVLQSIPIVLIQRTGSQNSQYKKIGYGSGWDIIIPSGYSLPFWLTLIMFGARSGGLRETESLAFEMGECYLPPDSEAGNNEEKRIEIQYKDKYFNRPPSKRVNYVKLGMCSPFICPWKILLKDWSSKTVNDIFVLRDKNHIESIQTSITEKKKLEPIKNADFCLVPVYLQISGKGHLGNHALICMPQAEDFSTMIKIIEPHHEDTNTKLRKTKRIEHRKTLKQLRKMRNKMKQVSEVNNTCQKPRSKEPSDYVKQMRDLWLPTVNTVRFTGIRETMGYISHGSYTFTEAKSCGVGYIAYNALQELLGNGYNQVLLRNTTSNKYRLANLHIIKDV